LNDAVALAFSHHRVMALFLYIDQQALIQHRHPGLR
jgi:hypothetical protein